MELVYIWASDLLLITIALFCVRLRGSELVAALSYVVCSGLHTLLTSESTPATIYYASAVVADFIALIALCCIRPVGKLVYGLACVCVFSIAANIAGFVLWFAYMPAWPYDVAFLGLYFYALVVVALGGADGMGGRPVRWNFARPAFPVRARRPSPN